MGDELGDRKDQFGCRSLLAYNVVDQARHCGARRIEFGLDPGAERAESVETLGARPLAIFALQVPCGHVVAAGVTKDNIQCLLHRHMPAAAANHDNQFPFMLNLRR